MPVEFKLLTAVVRDDCDPPLSREVLQHYFDDACVKCARAHFISTDDACKLMLDYRLAKSWWSYGGLRFDATIDPMVELRTALQAEVAQCAT